MKNKMINSAHIQGYLYDHKLTLKESGPSSKHPGTPFISGTVTIATDEDMLNTIDVHYTYVTQTTSSGKANSQWTDLKKIIDGVSPTVMSGAGKEKAAKVSINSAIGLNEFYSDRNGEETLVSAKRNEGGFFNSSLTKNEATFNTDFLITGCTHMEANEERGLPEKLKLHGAIFDFRNSLLPVDYSVVNPAAISYFEGLDPSNEHPVFMRVNGIQISQTVMRKIEKKSPWGEVTVQEVPNSYKDFVITGSDDPYMWDDESTLTVSELQDMIAKREITKADIKKRTDDYKASRSAGGFPAAASAAAPVAKGSYKF